MKIKTLVTWSLIISFFQFGNILLFGMLEGVSFSFAYGAFAIIFFGTIILSLRSRLQTKKELILAITLSLLMVVPMVILADNIKEYNDKSKEFEQAQIVLESEIEEISSSNRYFIEYITFIGDQISVLNDNSKSMQSEIDRIMAETAAIGRPAPAATPQAIPTTAQQIMTIPDYFEEDEHHEEEEEEDDD